MVIYFFSFERMKHVMFLCLLSLALIAIVYSNENVDNEQGVLQKQIRQVENTHEFRHMIRRGNPQCEPCGALRRPCCFPNLCRHQKPKPSKCFKVQK